MSEIVGVETVCIHRDADEVCAVTGEHLVGTQIRRILDDHDGSRVHECVGNERQPLLGSGGDDHLFGPTECRRRQRAGGDGLAQRIEPFRGSVLEGGGSAPADH